MRWQREVCYSAYLFYLFYGGYAVVLIDIAYAQGAASGRGAGDMLSSLFLFLPLILIFYFLIFRPQQKQRKELKQMLATLKKGDRIVTRGGLEGIIDKVEEKSLRIEVGTGMKLKLRRDYVDQVIRAEQPVRADQVARE